VTSSNGVGRHEVDVVVVGGGPSGLAAASWLGRYRRSVVVLDSREYRSGMVERSHGYLGRDPQTPLELIARGREEVLAYPTAQIRSGKVEQVVRRDDGLFEVDGGLLAHRVVLATGVKDELPDVEGIDEHYGASVFHCPACDGYEARDRDVIALGWDPQLVGFSATLKNWAKSVTVVTNGVRFQGDESCRVAMAEQEADLIELDAVRFLGSRGVEGGPATPAGVGHAGALARVVDVGCGAVHADGAHERATEPGGQTDVVHCVSERVPLSHGVFLRVKK
jgi:thioredoxin reductase